MRRFAATAVSVLVIGEWPAAASTQSTCDPAAVAVAISTASPGATIELTAGCTYVPTGPLQVVTQSLTINGNGATLARSAAAGTAAFTSTTGRGSSSLTPPSPPTRQPGTEAESGCPKEG